MKCVNTGSCVVLSVLFFAGVGLAAPFFPAQLSGGLQLGGGAGLSASSSSSSSETSAPAAGGGGLGGLTNVLSTVDIPGLLRGVNSFVKLVGVFCPPLSQVLDNVIQNVTSQAFRIFGRLILRNGLGGSGGSSGAAGGGQKVNVVLPTFPPDEDDYDEDSTDAQPSASETGSPAISDDAANSIVAKRHVRVARAAADEEDTDQEGAESAPQPAEDQNAEADDADRNKRFLPFGGAFSGGHAGSAGGSGNFLFDIIRNTADRAARTAGTVYRMVAGTENLGWGLTTNSETTHQITGAGASSPSAKLVAGSGATEESDEKANSPGGVVEVDVAKAADGYTEGIPGPITRLFVIANRGIANLVQDLILRLAQTSERLVNFKARLVTSLI